MKKQINIIALTILLGSSLFAFSCNKGQNSSVFENYYVINTNDIRNEMLVGSSIVLNPTFTNLGEIANPRYSVEIKLNDIDVTSTTYNNETKVFNPQEVGSYSIAFVVLNDDGTIYKTKDGNTFSKTIIIDVVIQSFAPRNNPGPDVTISDDGVITFGESYSQGNKDKVTSNQYKVTGLTFEGNYSITYELQNIRYDSVNSDPALYFGWVKNWAENNDDSIKLSTGNGTMATWVWDENGDLANLSSNRGHGWNKGGWWDAPGSVSNESPIEGNHTITFERYINQEKNKAVYGIIYDDKPFTYLDLDKNYTDVLTNVWVESNNTSGSIKVKEYKKVEDKVTPTLSLKYDSTYYVGDTINLKNGAIISDDSAYEGILTPTFKVFDKDNNELAVESGTFTPNSEGEYKIVAEVNDLAYNTAKSETKIFVNKVDLEKTIIDVSETSPVAMPDSGIILYYHAKKDNVDVPITSIKVLKGEEDVTSETLFTYSSKTVEDLSYQYFKAKEGNYKIIFTAEDGSTKEKEINVSATNTTIYGYTYYDLSNLIYKDKFIVGKNTIIYTNNGATDTQTVKLGMNVGKKYDWTIEFDITDLSYSAQGKMFITKNTINAEGTSIGWEDLSVGGNVKANGDPDLWGYECKVVGDEWISYQWRSNWQNPTNEFMPDPNDRTKGCGRDASEYTQYGYGTHRYKIECRMNDEGVVTYTYYIDQEVEVIHVTKPAHNYGNGMDFIQFSGEHMNGIVSNISIY